MSLSLNFMILTPFLCLFWRSRCRHTTLVMCTIINLHSLI